MRTFGVFIPGAMARSVDLYRSKKIFDRKRTSCLVLDSIYHISNKFTWGFNREDYYNKIADQILDSGCKQLYLVVNSNGTLESFLILEALLSRVVRNNSQIKKIVFTHISPLWFEQPLGDKKLLIKVINGFYNFIFRRNKDDYCSLISSVIPEINSPFTMQNVTELSDIKELAKIRSKLLYSILNTYESRDVKLQLKSFKKGEISLNELNSRCSKTVKRNLSAFYKTNNRSESVSLINLFVYLRCAIKHAYYTKKLFNLGFLVKYRSMLERFKSNGISFENNFVFVDRDIWLSKKRYQQIQHNIEMNLEPDFKCSYFYAPNTAHSSVEYFPDVFERFY